jgi:flagellar hook-basal body complex protein FliE
MDIRSSFAQAAYGGGRQAIQPREPAGDGPDFGKIAQSFADTVRNGEAQATAALTTGADPHALITALAETSLAVETAVTVRDKVVEAYQEILRMPV